MAHGIILGYRYHSCCSILYAEVLINTHPGHDQLFLPDGTGDTYDMDPFPWLACRRINNLFPLQLPQQ